MAIRGLRLYSGDSLAVTDQSSALVPHPKLETIKALGPLQRFLTELETKADPGIQPLPPAKDSIKKCKVMPPARALSLREEGYRVLGVDLTTIPGVSVLHVQAVVAEVGPDLSKFRSAAVFSS